MTYLQSLFRTPTEAEGFPNGLGVVKVMGRNSGFIAMHSALGSCVVDLCLVPEVDFFLDGPGGIVDYLYERIRANDKAVVVVAEGAGQKLMLICKCTYRSFQCSIQVTISKYRCMRVCVHMRMSTQDQT